MYQILLPLIIAIVPLQLENTTKWFIFVLYKVDESYVRKEKGK